MSSELFKENVGRTSIGYKVILSYEAFNEVTNQTTTKYAEVDVQDEGIEVKSNVELTSFPTLQGHHISDHIYRQPIEMTIKGSFADNGLKAYDWIGEDRLTRIQSEFEACQRAGVKFNIVTIRNDDANDRSNWRFLARRNMVLTSISWSQFQHHLQFSFSFKEAISSNLQIIEVKQDLTDPNLPMITDLSPASLVGELISSNDVIQMTVDVLRNLNLINDDTFKACVGFAVAGAGLSIASVGVISALAAAAAAGVSIPGVGWVVTAACAIAAGACAIFESIAAAKRAEQIAYYKSLGHVFLIDDSMSENEKNEVVRNFITFLGQVKQAVDDMLSDISVFRIAKADRQECTLIVNGTYYVQRIEKNTDDLTFRIECLYLGQTYVKSLPKIVALESFADCTEDQAYFRDRYGVAGSTYRVYIVSRTAYKQEVLNKQTNEDRLSKYFQTDKEKYEAEKENLLDFAFVVAPYSLDTFANRVGEVIKKIIG